MKHVKTFNEKLSKYELDSKIEKIINDHIKEIPYEGADVDKYGMKGSILDLIYEICPEYRPEGYGNNPW